MLLFYFSPQHLLICLRESACAHICGSMLGAGAEGKGETESQADSPLSAEPNTGQIP